ncbi:FMN-dependent dehydrogenase-domain-containing protein [Microdochium trichocladiopsis]|uniref:FMN-dependent dehydrogenase-domain-containing protein n=1 Tax=Microdochium trichocladiopsis TaxID=1682393 RepID=A0A9P9BVY8_9PEZI|nr:FMN-dependent dehydrogenase-domain-containing protein [Microdochium trichocladiopsis]KAH7040242.1 FMN-dependent dehydrogenase-domain-containing protein [Microdochium trichocladiopsis]
MANPRAAQWRNHTGITRPVLDSTVVLTSRPAWTDHSTYLVQQREQCIAAADNDPSSPRPSLEKAPPLHQLLSIADLQESALRVLSPKAISYYASASDDEITKHANSRIFQSILLRPRVFRDCTSCSLSTTIVGNKVGIPLFVSPAASARLAHRDGETGIARACARFGALQVISHNASMRPADIVNSVNTRTSMSDAASPYGHESNLPPVSFAWQLYVLKDLATSERILAEIKKLPQIKFIVLTLDAPFPGKREADERHKARDLRTGGAQAQPQVWGTEAGLTWHKTLSWLVRHTDLPIVLKGLQSWEDVYLAASLAEPQQGQQYPFSGRLRGVILSNHGGRALDTTTTPVHVLLDIHRFCPEVLSKLDILIDGGIQRGTDIVKALALGAKAVGIGRAALYGLAVGGEDGVARALEILAEETTTAMKLLGVTSPDELRPHHVSLCSLSSQLTRAVFIHFCSRGRQ